jgi:DNA invertase Pin-like site-specific DNA recombinase
MESKLTLTIGYVRLTALESLRTGLSAPAQRQDIAEYCERNGLSNLQILEEPKAVGGDVRFEKRPMGRELISKVRAGLVGVIVVRDIDRLTRDLHLWLELDALCQENAVQIHTLSGLLSTASPSDRFATRVRAAAAQLEREQTGDRNRRAKRQMAQQGRQVGGPPPFGYTSQARHKHDLIAAGQDEVTASEMAMATYPIAKSLYVDPSEAIVVKLIFKLYTAGRMGGRAVASELNRRGFRRRGGRPWIMSRVTRLLSNPVYAALIPYDEERYHRGRGAFAPKEKQHLFPGKHRALVSESVWRNALAIKAERRSSANNRGDAGVASRKYPLAGILQCACGCTMRAASVNRTKRAAYYVCRNRYHYGPDASMGCDKPRARMESVHEAFWSTLRRLLNTPDLIERIFAIAKRRSLESVHDEIDPTAQVAKIRSDIDGWYERHDSATTKVEKDAAWSRILELKTRVGQLEQAAALTPVSAQPPAITRPEIAKFLTSLGKSTSKASIALCQLLVRDHGLRVRLIDGVSIEINLSLRPPGTGEPVPYAESVQLSETVRIPGREIDEWLLAKQDKCRCVICGELVTVLRRHYWLGLPKHHRRCWLKQKAEQRANPKPGFLNALQVAKELGVGRTTVGRWIASGKLKPSGKYRGVWLFEKSQIKKLKGAT